MRSVFGSKSHREVERENEQDLRHEDLLAYCLMVVDQCTEELRTNQSTDHTKSLSIPRHVVAYSVIIEKSVKS